MSQFVGVVLAAGRSSRMGFNKLVHPLEGDSLVSYPVRHLTEAQVDRIVVVVGYDRQTVMACLGPSHTYVVQERQEGTADAAATATPALDDAEHVVVLFGDCPFMDGVTIAAAMSKHLETRSDLTIATAQLGQTRNMGRLRRDKEGKPKKVEDGRTSRSFEPGEVFTGLSVWTRRTFEEVLPHLPERIKPDSIERDLPDAVEYLMRREGRVTTVDVDPADALAPNDLDEFAEAADYLRRKIKHHLIGTGVRIPDFMQVRVDHTSRVGEGTLLETGSQILGVTQVGRDCVIGPGATLKDCVVGDRATVGRGVWEGLHFAPESKASDRLASEHRYFRKPYYLIAEEPRYCFALMPFTEAYLGRFERVIRPALARMGFFAEIAADERLDGPIVEGIWESINRSSFVIADVTDPNPNVWYELGMAHALNKRVLLLCERRVAQLPFDIRGLRTNFYSLENGDLGEVVEAYLRANFPDFSS